MTLSADLLTRFTAASGPGNATTDAAAIAPHLSEWRGRWHGRTALMLMPRRVEEISRILALAHETRTPIVTQGGNTGLVGAQVPDESGNEVLLVTQRLNAIRAIDADNDSMVAEAGVVLADAQRIAAENDRLFPLSLAAEGSATIGGNLSTNAGGTAVLRYGNARDLVLGLEVVLPDGSVMNTLSALRKDNTGYDLKHLFMGAEGTLGVITAATLKLFPWPRVTETAFAGVPDPVAAINLFRRLKRDAGDALTAFELVPAIAIELAAKHIPGIRPPFAKPPAWAVLIELSSSAMWPLRNVLEASLGAAIEAGDVRDAALASSAREATNLWHLRESLSEAQKREGASLKHDIAVPVSRIPAFIREASLAVTSAWPGVRPVIFGHVGDGNLHFNISQPSGARAEDFLAHQEAIAGLIHSIVAAHDGSISAEHGIGRMKAALLPQFKDKTALELMRTLKRAIDPHNIMNPGRVLGD
ncbi:MAG TPA: FAD-binding oxidoreductase [Micropepsaceae bacterium]|nr:FAD-binding oxidoreductase [Micropepsaceae bacterium]